MNKEDLHREAWFPGQLMAFSALDGRTDYAFGLVARTTRTGIEIRDPDRGAIAFQEASTGTVCFGGDFFAFEGSSGPVRGAFVDAHHLLIEGACAAGEVAETLRVHEENGRLLIGTREYFTADLIRSDFDHLLKQRRRWLLDRPVPENLDASARRTLARALTLMKSQVYSPEGVLTRRWTTPDRWPHKDMWLWDTAFHAIGWRHVDPALAMEMIDAMFELQRADGFLTYRATPAGPYFHLGDQVTQPPVLAHAARLVHRIAGDDGWFEALYPKLCGYVEWDIHHRDTDGGGLMEWFIEEDPNCRSGESGMDNSPRFDSARKLDAVDFNCYLARECEVLANLAARLGRTDESREWMRRHADFCRLLNERCWSEDKGFYFDHDPATGKRSEVWACVGFLPLYCGAASREQAEQLSQQLDDPDRFGTALPVASVAVCDTENYSKDLCRGPVWVQINWLIAAGFERYGLHEAAGKIRSATTKEIERSCENFGVLFEYYDDRGEVEAPDLLRKGKCSPEPNPYHQVIHDFGWTATLYVDWMVRRHVE